jgi:hypothetical protein
VFERTIQKYRAQPANRSKVINRGILVHLVERFSRSLIVALRSRKWGLVNLGMFMGMSSRMAADLQQSVSNFPDGRFGVIGPTGICLLCLKK